MLSSQHRRYETKARPSSRSNSGAGAALCWYDFWVHPGEPIACTHYFHEFYSYVVLPNCDYPRCKCAFLWCEGKHPPCPITGKRHPEMLT